MSEDLDPNKIAAEFIKINFEQLASMAVKLGQSAASNLKLRLRSSYDIYLRTVLDRYSKTKSFFIRNAPVPLYTFYEPVSLKLGNSEIPGVTMASLSAIAPHAIVVGLAGCGKTMLLKHLLISAIRSGSKVPALIELRQIDKENPQVLKMFFDGMRFNGFDFEDRFLKKALLEGHFVLLIDGLDEVPPSARKIVGEQIRAICQKYPKNYMVLTSRPDHDLEGWSGFSVAKICPLNVTQAVSLVGKLHFDEVVKAKFLEELSNGLFQKHSSFLSNPLLLSIMLLSYGQSAQIPSKLSVFYSQAYEALFQRHDALKEGFARERLTHLDVQDFARAFSAFSLLSYDSYTYKFDDSAALALSKRSSKLSQLPFDPQDFLTDVLESVCLLIRDGSEITYTHRSFQEYFTAKFICDSQAEIQMKILVEYSKRRDISPVLELVGEMRSDALHDYVTIPFIQEIRRIVDNAEELNLDGYTVFLKEVFDSFEFRDGHWSATFNQKLPIQLIFFIQRYYGLSESRKLQTRVDSDGWNALIASQKVDHLKLAFASGKEPFIQYFKIHDSHFSMASLNELLNLGKSLAEQKSTRLASIDEILKMS